MNSLNMALMRLFILILVTANYWATFPILYLIKEALRNAH